MSRYGWVAAALLGALAGPCAAAGEGDAPRQTVAVLPFAPIAGKPEFDALAANMADFIMAAVSQSVRFVCVNRGDLDKVLSEQAFALSADADVKDRVKVGRLVGAQFVISGGFVVVGKTLRLNGHFVEVETGRILRSAQAEADLPDIEAAVRKLGEGLTESRLPAIGEVRQWELARRPLARLHFARGLGYWYAAMPDLAAVELMKSLMFDPKYPEARYWSGRARLEDGEPAHARIEFERFLADFPEHQLAGAVRTLLARCGDAPDRSPQKKAEADDKEKP